jgi:hypothetical protein
MEQQVWNKLTSRDQDLLAALWETEVIKSIAHAGDLYQQDKALHISMVADSMENVLLNRGNIQGARFIFDLAKFAHQRQKRKDN